MKPHTRTALPPMHRLRRLLALALAASMLTLVTVGCDSDEENDDMTDTAGSDATDATADVAAVEVDGQPKTYRFTALQLEEPDVSLRRILNSIIQGSIDLPPGEPESVNILLRMDNWDVMAEPPTLTLEAGAGAPVAMTDPTEFTWSQEGAENLVQVPATYALADGAFRIRNEEPTNLFFPISVNMATTLLPLRDIRLDTCYGSSSSCSGTDESEIYGELTGGIIVSEADTIEVELSESETIQLGELLRDPREDLTCGSDADCEGIRTSCNADGVCERAPEMMVNGEPAFALSGEFKAELVGFQAP